MQLLVAFCPAKGPVAGFGDPGHHDEDDENADLHTEKTAKVDDGLFQPPPDIWRATIVSRLNGLRGLANGCETDKTGKDLEEDDKNRNTESGLSSKVSGSDMKSKSTADTYIDGEVEEVKGAWVGSIIVVIGTRSNG